MNQILKTKEIKFINNITVKNNNIIICDPFILKEVKGTKTISQKYTVSLPFSIENNKYYIFYLEEIKPLVVKNHSGKNITNIQFGYYLDLNNKNKTKNIEHTHLDFIGTFTVDKATFMIGDPKNVFKNITVKKIDETGERFIWNNCFVSLTIFGDGLYPVFLVYKYKTVVGVFVSLTSINMKRGDQ